MIVMSRRSLVVLQSFGAIRRTTNPYLAQLVAALPEDVSWVPFSWRTALFGRFDVLHVHWPELVFVREGRLRTLAGALLFRLLLLRIQMRRIALVRTVHNPEPHNDRGAIVRRLLMACDRATTLWICLNPHTLVPTAAPAEVIALGDYIQWFTGRTVPHSLQGRLLFFGLVRPYKNVEHLVTQFTALPDRLATLRVVGSPDPRELSDRIRDAAAGDGRVSLELRFLEDDELVEEIGRSELVVLPYTELHNSSAALLALSLQRPVLVPDNAATGALAAEIGERWVQRYRGELDTAQLGAALAAVRATRDSAPPQLAARAWPALGAAHGRAYARAVTIARPLGSGEIPRSN